MPSERFRFEIVVRHSRIKVAREEDRPVKDFLEDHSFMSGDVMLAVLEAALAGANDQELRGEVTEMLANPDVTVVRQDYIEQPSEIDTAELRELLIAWMAFQRKQQEALGYLGWPST